MDPDETLYSDQRLEQFLALNRGSPPRQMIGDLVADVKRLASGAPQSDDITALALLYLGATGPMKKELEIKVTNQLSAIERFNQAFTEFGRRYRLAPKILHDVNLAVEEILANIISYGYTDNREEHEIKLGVSVQPGEVRVDVEDDGRPFNPLEAPEPDTTKPLEERTVGGLGIHLVRKLMDSLEYKRRDNKNFLTLKKKTQES